METLTKLFQMFCLMSVGFSILWVIGDIVCGSFSDFKDFIADVILGIGTSFVFTTLVGIGILLVDIWGG